MITHPTGNDTQANINLVRMAFNGIALPEKVTIPFLCDLINQDLMALQDDNQRLRNRIVWLTMPERMEIIEKSQNPEILAAAKGEEYIPAAKESELQKEVSNLKAMVEQLVKSIPKNTVTV